MTDKHNADHSAIDPKLVRQLAKMLTETHLSEIEVEKGDLRIRVARQMTQAAPVAVQVAAPAPVAAPVVTAANHHTQAKPKEVAGGVPSPMVGTAYRRPSPEAKAYVEVGSTVSAGDKILLIEAMKTLGQQTVNHVAITIEAKKPKIKHRIDAMRQNIARIMHLSISQVGITATSGEGLTDFGCGDGVQAFAIVTTQELS